MVPVRTIDVHEELATARVGPLHRWLCAMMAILTLFDGYGTFNPAYVIHYVSGPWGLTLGQAGLLVSSGLSGFLIGAATHGAIADSYGRRGTLLGGLWIASAFTVATPLLGNSFLGFCLVRIGTGIGLGVLLPLATTYVAELAPKRVANTFAVWGVALGWAAGGAAAGLAGVFLTPQYGWHVLYWIGGLSIPLALILHAFLPESPKFLSDKGRIEEIRGLLSRLRPERAELYQDGEIRTMPAKAPGNRLATLLSERYRPVTLRLWGAAFLSLFCIYGLTSWIPTVMMKRGETFAASFGYGALIQAMSFAGGLACGHLADRYGASRMGLSAWWATGGFVVFGLITFNSHWFNLLAVAAAGFFIVGAQFVLNNFTAASYETNVRATGVGMMLSTGRVGAVIGPYVAGALQQSFHGPEAMFLAIGAAAVAAAIVIGTLPRSA